jgi:hypothetical protein
MLYNVGTANIVSTLPKLSPAMMVTAMATQNTSGNNGITPSTVVPAASAGLNPRRAHLVSVSFVTYFPVGMPTR